MCIGDSVMRSVGVFKAASRWENRTTWDMRYRKLGPPAQAAGQVSCLKTPQRQDLPSEATGKTIPVKAPRTRMARLGCFFTGFPAMKSNLVWLVWPS
ncbi:unnamed protein product [Protopolystoma xenopodis]|uniref:Uncharacterized protein n=1 Tax=Protopolystoma xenopodis TaxID=117903 RepID=A0A3S5AW36_9PLAT|nr:unnamed protein product [Protopolystoma xenopodis]